MDLSLELIDQSGGFVKDALVKKEITFTDKNSGKPVKADVYIKKLSYHTIVSEVGHAGDFLAARIASSVCNKTGKPIFTAEQVSGGSGAGALSADLTSALLNAIGEVNSLGKPSTE